MGKGSGDSMNFVQPSFTLIVGAAMLLLDLVMVGYALTYQLRVALRARRPGMVPEVLAEPIYPIPFLYAVAALTALSSFPLLLIGLSGK